MSKRTVRSSIAAAFVFSVLLVFTSLLVGCVHRSGGTWYVKEAPTPEGWPELSVPGTVEVKLYPEYRAAVVTKDDVSSDRMGPMFNELFGHIKRNDIAMTAPVDLGGVERNGSKMSMDSMAFLYEKQAFGPEGSDGVVEVRDFESRHYATAAVRGNYTIKHYEFGLALLADWIGSQQEWMQDGPPRYLGYNGPFVPGPFKYGEVQIPVRRAE